jgi:hypothetical protein
LNDWLVILVFPVALYLGWFIVVKNILNRPQITRVPLDDFEIIAITILFMVYGFVGNSIHFTGKILWRYLEADRHQMAYKVNEMFHGKLSHYLIFLNSLFIAFLLPILEINHPLVLPVTSSYLLLILLAGIIFGISGCKSVFYSNEWFGGYNKPLFYVTIILLSILISFIKGLQLKFSLHPVALFITTMFASAVTTFLIRQFFIFSRLSQKRKLRFLAKILSV